MIRRSLLLAVVCTVAVLLGCGPEGEAAPAEAAEPVEDQIAADPASDPKDERAPEPSAEPVPLSPDEAALRSVLDAIIEKWGKVDSFTATATVTGKMPIGPIILRTKGSGTAESMRIEGRRRFRMEMPMEFSSDMAAMGSMTGRMLTVSDGEATYLEMEMMGQKKVGRKASSKSGAQPPPDGAAMFEELRKKGRLSLLPEDAIDGDAVYVLELKLKKEQTEKAPGRPVTMRLYYAKDTGLSLKVVSFDEEGELIASRTYSDVTINPELDPARFTYSPPPGVEVEDVEEKDGGLPRLPF